MVLTVQSKNSSLNVTMRRTSLSYSSYSYRCRSGWQSCYWRWYRYRLLDFWFISCWYWYNMRALFFKVSFEILILHNCFTSELFCVLAPKGQSVQKISFHAGEWNNVCWSAHFETLIRLVRIITLNCFVEARLWQTSSAINSLTFLALHGCQCNTVTQQANKRLQDVFFAKEVNSCEHIFW